MLTMLPSLSNRLKHATGDLHKAAERSPVMAALLRGQLSATAYGQLLLNLAGIYGALEAALRTHENDPLLTGLGLHDMARSAALALDLRSLGLPWPTTNEGLMPATREYQARLQRLDATAGHLLAAHAYVRYLGDLAGGQMLKRIVARSLGAGTAFYEFCEPPTPAQRALAFRSALDAAAVNETDALAMVSEAQWSFAQHQQLFEQLAADPGSAFTMTGPAR
jgi:heme oxygenase